MNKYCDKHGQLRPCTDCLTNSLYDDALFADDCLYAAYTRGVADGRRELEKRLAAAEAKIPRWIPVSERLPPLGVKVDIMLGGVVQDETYELEKEDDDWGLGKYFWSRDDLDECPSVNWENDMWMPRPKAQQVEGER